MPRPLTAVIFDLDGTLVDSFAALAASINHARRELGLRDVDGDLVRRSVGDGVERLLERVFEPDPVPRNARGLFEDHYDSICCAESRVLPGAAETLDELRGLGLAMGVCTNKPTGFSQKILDALGLGRYFAAVVGPDLAGARKPHARHLLYTLKAVGAEPERALYVGDMPVDIQAARAAGVAVAVLPTGSSERHELTAASPDFLLQSMPELVELVRRANAVAAR